MPTTIVADTDNYTIECHGHPYYSIRFNKRTTLNERMVLDIHEAHDHNRKGDPIFLITYLSKVVYADASARKIIKIPSIRDSIKANALVVESPVSRMVAQFLIGMMQSNFPNAIFANSEAAFEWLKQFDTLNRN